MMSKNAAMTTCSFPVCSRSGSVSLEWVSQHLDFTHLVADKQNCELRLSPYLEELCGEKGDKKLAKMSGVQE